MSKNHGHVCTALGFALVLAVGIAGCSSPSPFSRPTSVPALSGLMDQTPAATRTAIRGARDKKLTVVFSKTTGYSREFNDLMRRQYSAWVVQFSLPHLAADVDAVLSDERLTSALFGPLRSSFREVQLVRDIPEGFESGADYVGILDLDLNMDIESSFPSQRIKHIAKVSLLFIDPELGAGPLVSSGQEHLQETFAKGADGNIRDTLYAVKTARTKMLSDFEADFSQKVSR